MSYVFQAEAIEALLPEWISKQRWFSHSDEPPKSARIVDSETIHESQDGARLIWTIVEMDGGATYQVPLGCRKDEKVGEISLGSPESHIGVVEDTVVYDALMDSDLSKALFALITGGKEKVDSVRPIGADQSNTSLVFDNRLMLKLFRRMHEGANPDLEVSTRLSNANYAHVAPVVATWERGDRDLAICQPYLAGGTEGWALAVASVRDLLKPGTLDFVAEARRLGEMTAELHVAMSEAFPVHPFDPLLLASSLENDEIALEPDQQIARGELVTQLRNMRSGSAGMSVRVHGDYHLGQTLRTATRWYVFDFEGEPARPMEERTHPTSPIKDVAGMVRSFQYAAAVGLAEQTISERNAYVEPVLEWERNTNDAFREGYLSVEKVNALLPADTDDLALLFKGFETEKALYEVAYERAHRPDWVSIPEAALKRLLG